MDIYETLQEHLANYDNEEVVLIFDDEKILESSNVKFESDIEFYENLKIVDTDHPSFFSIVKNGTKFQLAIWFIYEVIGSDSDRNVLCEILLESDEISEIVGMFKNKWFECEFDDRSYLNGQNSLMLLKEFKKLL